MDGTGFLFEPILRLWTEETAPIVLSYPADRILDYKELESYVSARLPVSEPYVLIAESYGGPLGVLIAAKHPLMLRGLVLSATYVRRPRGRIGNLLRFLIGPYLCRRSWTRFLTKSMMKLQGLSEQLIQLVVKALVQAEPRVRAARLKDALGVEAFEDLKNCDVPVLCLYAERDWLLADHCREDIRKADPKAKLVGLDTPHFLLQDKPAEALREILAFVKTLNPA
ncbi:MAG: hypothetical protein A3A86_06915 [Elusimicrobia bacterium RIFCSPLOWO2_01_FULL_60_11]|nr:MAG: hypothetical protein A3A86_06915 [Elusimicrobia bacterium RIFCSPLOWO2_01_FULL_60_11]